MSFLDSVTETDIRYKQVRLNLSRQALSMIDSDIMNFNTDARYERFNRSSFICHVFIRSKNYLNSFVSNQIEKADNAFSDFFTENDSISEHFTSEQLENINYYIVDKMIEQEKQHCSERIRKISSAKFKSIIIFLNTETVRFLRDNDLYLEEELYDGRLSRFMKNVLEEYAELSYLEREKIVFDDEIGTLESMCQNNLAKGNHYETIRLLNSRNERDIRYTVIPFAIRSDMTNTYHYLLCYSKRTDSDSYYMVKFRLSHIRLMENTRDTVTKRIPKEDKTILGEWLEHGFRMFDIKPTKIKVRFTETGRKLYGIIRHNRPLLIEEKDDICIFECSEIEAANYFTAFTGEAVILEPLSLREKLYQRYQYGVEQYAKEFETGNPI